MAILCSYESSPVSNHCWKIKVKLSVSSYDNSLHILYGLLSRPEALITLTLTSNFWCPYMVMYSCWIVWKHGPIRWTSVESYFVNTDLNCLLRMSALSKVLMCRVPIDFRQGNPMLSCIWDVMYFFLYFVSFFLICMVFIPMFLFVCFPWMVV